MSFRLFLLNKVEKPIEEILSTEATEEDFKYAIKDIIYEYGAKYSRDGKKLLKAYYSLWEKQYYVVREGTEVICDRAFRGCEFESITIPNSVTSIGDEAFSGCESLHSITIPNSVRNIGNNAFRGCNIYFFICNSTYFQNDDVCLFNKDKTAIVSRIKYCVNYIIPNSVTYIGDGAFSGCESLQSITIPNSVTSIGHRAFFKCTHLDEPSRLRLKELNYTQF